MENRHYALAREAILAALTAYTGITTADGATPVYNTLIDANLKGRNNFITEKTILIGSGDAAYEDSGASDFDPDTGAITVTDAFSAQIKAGTIFRVLNISSVEIDVETINTKIGTSADAAGTGSVFARLRQIVDDYLADGTIGLAALKTLIEAAEAKLDKLPNTEHETEWATTPVSQQVTSAAATNLTAGSVTPTFPTGATRVRAILVASIHAANQDANTHHIGLKVQGQKAGGGYGDLIDLTTTPPLALVNLDGAGDGWCGAIDVTTLVDTSAVQYDFRFVVDSDNAGAVNYTTGFSLVLVYRI